MTVDILAIFAHPDDVELAVGGTLDIVRVCKDRKDVNSHIAVLF